ncbi:MAG: AAA family ATPase [Anaerostipes hadrus]
MEDGAGEYMLLQYSTDLTEKAMLGKLDPMIGRENEMERLMQILCRRTKNNPCLIGDPGVGKTAIVEGLAQRIAEGNMPRILKNKRILSLDLTKVIAGTKFRGEFEERMKRIVTEATQDDSIILFIDEIHTIIGAGGSEELWMHLIS